MISAETVMNVRKKMSMLDASFEGIPLRESNCAESTISGLGFSSRTSEQSVGCGETTLCELDSRALE